MSDSADPSITPDDVRHVAKLSRLELTDVQVAMFSQQLELIMEHIDKLAAIDVSGVEPMVHAYEQTNVLREDMEHAGMSVDQALANAPDRDDPFFKVPKVLGEGSS